MLTLCRFLFGVSVGDLDSVLGDPVDRGAVVIVDLDLVENFIDSVDLVGGPRTRAGRLDQSSDMPQRDAPPGSWKRRPFPPRLEVLL